MSKPLPIYQYFSIQIMIHYRFLTLTFHYSKNYYLLINRNLRELKKEDLIGGWFDISYLESSQIESNKYYSHRGELEEKGEELSQLEHRVLVEEFFNYEKMKNDFLNFITKFFDNSKTNMYKNIVQKYEEKAKKNFFDFFFKSINKYSYSFDFMKTKKNLMNFIKILIDTSNEEIMNKYVKYFKNNIYKFTKAAEKTHSQMVQRGKSI